MKSLRNDTAAATPLRLEPRATFTVGTAAPIASLSLREIQTSRTKQLQERRVMTKISFYYIPYHNNTKKTLTQLLEKVIGRGWRAVVVVQSHQDVKELDKYLWCYDRTSFLVHGCPPDDPRIYPIWLSKHIENPNHANALILLTKTIPTEDMLDSYELVCVLTDEDVSNTWRTYTKTHTITRYKQGKNGQWKEY